jgi:HD superfamily phosphohydrolase
LDQEKIEKVKMYGLVHDLGHCAFSHEGEHILSKYLGNHEEVGKKNDKGERNRRHNK